MTLLELNNLFLEEAQVFVKLLNENPDSEELSVVKDRVHAIMAEIEKRKEGL